MAVFRKCSIPILFTAILITLILGVGGGGNTNTSTTTWLVVDDLGLFLHGDWDDLWGQVEILTEVLNTLIGQYPVVVSPGELLLHKTTGSQ